MKRFILGCLFVVTLGIMPCYAKSNGDVDEATAVQWALKNVDNVYSFDANNESSIIQTAQMEMTPDVWNEYKRHMTDANISAFLKTNKLHEVIVNDTDPGDMIIHEAENHKSCDVEFPIKILFEDSHGKAKFTHQMYVVADIKKHGANYIFDHLELNRVKA